MKIFKRISIVLFTVLLICSVSGFFYFNKKFTPPDNYLDVQGTCEEMPIVWEASEDSPISALLLPVHFKNIPTKFYMQVDFGSPVTVFYSQSLKSIQKKYPNEFNYSDSLSNLNWSFALGKMKVSSSRFRILNYGDSVMWDNPNSKNVIGTIGTDLLEKRVTIMNLKNNVCSFVESKPDSVGLFSDFQFKKRRILLPAKIAGEMVLVLFDSGTSAFELITSEESWKRYAVKGCEVKTEQGNSWGKTLTVFTTRCNEPIEFGTTQLKLSEVTYIEGTSLIQNTLMRFSGMQGMIGNKIFLNHTIILDCANQKFIVY